MASVAGQYRCHAYVCGNACVQHVDNMGTVTFTWLFLHRPSDCRYVIVSQWNVAKGCEEVKVFDLFTALNNQRTGELIPPEPMWVGDDVDAAIMATQLRYEDN